MPESFVALPPPLVDLALSAWWFVLGGCVGSFLNVVAYRLPAGLSIASPPSHCPLCKTPIRWRDNLPIVGWLFLRGRCRDCHAPIAKRYPLVELLTAVLFLAVARAIALSGGGYASVFQAWGATLYCLTLLCTLWSGALMEYDGRCPPFRWALPAVLLGLVAPLLWPFLLRLTPTGAVESWLRSLAEHALGLTTGLAAGAVLAWLAAPSRWRGALLGATLVGMFLGWRAAGVVALALAPLAVYERRRAGRAAIPLSGWLLLAALAWIVVARAMTPP